MNTLNKGKSVLVTDYQGVKHLKKVWDDTGDVILITSESNFYALKRGLSHIWPIGVPRATVEEATSI